jgi:hypothetical protein
MAVATRAGGMLWGCVVPEDSHGVIDLVSDMMCEIVTPTGCGVQREATYNIPYLPFRYPTLPMSAKNSLTILATEQNPTPSRPVRGESGQMVCFVSGDS